MITDNFEALAAANEALNADLRKAADLLPTRAEVLEALAASDLGMPDLIVDEPLEQFEVIFRASPTWAKDLDGEVELNAVDYSDLELTEAELALLAPKVPGAVRCHICERKAGEVTVDLAFDGIGRQYRV